MADSYDAGNQNDKKWLISRKEFLKSSSAAAAGLLFQPYRSLAGSEQPVRIGIATDPHFANIDQWNSRYYRESLAKMEECIELMNDKKVDFMIELGDFMNGAPNDNLEHLRTIESVYSKFNGPRYHVLGNHDMESLSKARFQSVVENTGIPRESTFYSFDRRGLHIVVLDANFLSDGSPYDTGNFHWTDANIPTGQLEWLQEDLKEVTIPVIVCVHQLLDQDEGDHYINNAAEVRGILEDHSNILAVFHGHQHQGQYKHINGIHYYTFRAMVEGSGHENNAYSIVDVHGDGSLTITGYRKAESRQLSGI